MLFIQINTVIIINNTQPGAHEEEGRTVEPLYTCTTIYIYKKPYLSITI